MTREAFDLAVRRLAGDGDLLLERTLVLLGELASYAPIPSAALAESARRNLDTAVRALRSGRELSPEELPESGITRERARQGVPIEDMLWGYRANIGVIQRRFIEIAFTEGVAPELMLDGSRLLWSLGDAFTHQVMRWYQEWTVEQALRDSHLREEFVRELLTGTIGQADLGRRCAAYGLDEFGRYAAVRARGESRGGVEELRRLLERRGSAPGRPALIAVLGGECAGVVARRPAPVPGLVVGVGARLPLARQAESFHIAGNVLEAATRLHTEGVFALEDLSWRVAAANAPEVGAYLVERYLTPLREHGEFGRQLEVTLRAYLDNGQNIARTAAALVVHVNTLRHRLNRFTELTGASLTSTEVIVELAWALEFGALD
ncbi:MAG: PucR family transcriptional regulator [Nonomuraea muscovyensis]|nr:PucR family transcriptional regulator [Nonomuraea muscovyensis]